MLNALLALNELDTKVFDSPSPGEVPRVYDDYITVPDAHLLFNGEFKRVGTSDLKIVGEDGKSFFIPDYFAADERAHLMSPQGATLSPQVVETLAGPLAPGQQAQAGAQPASTQPVIGRVDALSGSATAVRNGVTVTLNVGETVRRGDVIQTSGGSSVSIVFADGTALSLNANARMVLDNFVYAAGGTNNSALISLVEGTFSFVAGQVAKTGDMRVETPVATMGIRGTAVLVEISSSDGQTRFSVMVEPDGTTGSFNLYNKTTGGLIATVSSSQIGWLVSPAGPLQVVAEQFQKSPAQLQQELGIVQQIFTIFNNNQQNPFTPTQDRGDVNDSNPQTAGGIGSGGSLQSGVVTFADLINSFSKNGLLAPIGFNIPLPGDPLLHVDPNPVVTVTVSPNRPPVAVDDDGGTPGGGDVIDNDDDPEGGIIVVQSVQHIDPVQGVPTGPIVQIAKNDADGETIEGTYGTLTIHPDGTYTYVPHGAAFKALAAGVAGIDQFQYTITDPFGLTSSAILTINLSGVNDVPVVTGTVSGVATEDAQAVALNALENASDVDTGTTLEVVLPADLPAGVTYDADTHSFILDPGDPEYQSLAAGQKITVTVEYGVSDGTATTPASVSWTVTGTNDAPEISFEVGNDAGAVKEDDALIATGQLTASDPDAGATAAWSIKGSATGTYGSIAVDATGKWTYTLNNTSDAVQSLAEGETKTDTFTVKVTDGKGGYDTQIVTITVTGTNDAPEISFEVGNDAGAVKEDDALIATGQLTASDRDAGATAAWSIKGSATGTYGSIAVDATGKWTYTLDNASDAVQSLAEGETKTDTFTVKVTDGKGGYDTQIVTITVTGTNDAPEISFEVGNDAGAVKEDDALIATGQLTASDRDAGATAAWSIKGSATGTYGSIAVDATGKWTYTLDNASDAVQSLAEGETKTDTFTVKVTDGKGGYDTQIVTITVTGTNDVPTAVIDSDSVQAAGFIDGVPTFGDPFAVGNVLANDADVDAGNSIEVVGLSNSLSVHGTYVAKGTYGFLVLKPDGTYHYTLNNLDPDTIALGEGETGEEVFTYTIEDESGAQSTATLTINVAGANNAPVIYGGLTTGTVIEEGRGWFGEVRGDDDASGWLNTFDPDGDDHAGNDAWSVVRGFGQTANPDGSVTGRYGTFTVDENGHWTYCLDDALPATQALSLGQTAYEFFTVKVTDSHGASDTRTVTVTVRGSNDAPVIFGGDTEGTVIETGYDAAGSPRGKADASGSLLKNDVDSSDHSGNDAWSVVGSDGQQVSQNGKTVTGQFGSLTINQAGQWTYTLDNGAAQALKLGQTEYETFTVKVRDAQGAFDTETVTITVEGSNDEPVAENDVLENIPLGWTLGPNNHLYKYVSASQINWHSAAAAALAGGGYLATITSEAENDLVFSLVGNKVAWLGGSDAGHEGTWTWVTGETFDFARWAGGEPNNRGDWEYFLSGEDYLVTWGNQNWNDLDNSLSDRQSVHGYVIERTGDPNAHYLQITEDSAVAFAAGLLLANDTDVDGDTLSVISVAQSSQYGAALSLANGQITYNASQSAYLQSLSAGQTHTDTFSYTISDGNGGTSTATVTLTVNGINDAPHDLAFRPADALASAEGGLGLGGQRTLGQVVATDPDANDTLSYSLGSGSSSGFSLTGSGTLKTGLLGVGSGTYNLNLVATDQSGASTSEQLTIWVGNNGGLFSSGNDTKSFAGQSNDVLAFGRGGNDNITGSAHNDALIGGAGNDTLKGGLGDDTLTGGSGHNSFVFTSGDGKDVITDFSRADDKLWLYGIDFGGDFDAWKQLHVSVSNVGDTLIDFGAGNSITLHGVTGPLTANHFILHA